MSGNLDFCVLKKILWQGVWRDVQPYWKADHEFQCKFSFVYIS